MYSGFGVVIEDHSDTYDAVKWDFPENMDVRYVDNDPYPYKAKNMENAKILSKIRKHIDKVCKKIKKDRKNIRAPKKEYLDGVDVFLGLHLENHYNAATLPEPFYSMSVSNVPTSRYLLSEIPKNTGFDGLNKPKMRYEEIGAPSVGKDKNGRALYRDIFLNLDKDYDDLNELIIHELAHSMANHIKFRPNDHHEDFQWCEKLITNYW